MLFLLILHVPETSLRGGVRVAVRVSRSNNNNNNDGDGGIKAGGTPTPLLVALQTVAPRVVFDNFGQQNYPYSRGGEKNNDTEGGGMGGDIVGGHHGGGGDND